MQKTLIYSHTGLTSKQIGLTTEIIEGLISDDKKDIRILLCDNVLQNCYFNRTHNLLGCASCQSRQRHLLKQAGIKKEQILTLKKNEDPDQNFPFFNSTDELMAYDYKSIDIGRGVASSIISYYRDLHLNSDKYDSLIKIELSKAITVVNNIIDIYGDWSFDEIYLFNGRFSEAWPVVKFAENNSIPFYTMESGAHERYELFENALPHSMVARHKKILTGWKKADKTNRDVIGHEWFTNRKSRVDKFEISFAKEQVSDQLPLGFDRSKRNISIFNSSEDEMASISEYKNDIYTNQNEAIIQILDFYKEKAAFQFYLRMHPNLAGVDNVQTNEIYRLKYPNLTIIKPKEQIDTYALMSACEKTISFGSSTGIEATYWGKPSLLYGKAFHMYLDCVYMPKSFEKLKDLINDENLVAKPQESTIPFGYFMMTYGQKPKYFKYNGINKSSYKNIRIKKFYSATIPLFMKYLSNFNLWKRLHYVYYGSKLSLKTLFKYK